jgi:hypothetical protein
MGRIVSYTSTGSYELPDPGQKIRIRQKRSGSATLALRLKILIKGKKLFSL